MWSDSERDILVLFVLFYILFFLLNKYRMMENTSKNIDWKSETERRVQAGVALFKEGYNCSQSVALAFADWYGVPRDMMAKMSAPYGGGIGRMRETCGSALGVFMLAGLETSCPEANQEVKAKTYKAVQELAADFKEQTGSIVCKELLGLNKQRVDGSIPEITICHTPEARTDEYYRKRPCVRMVETGIRTYMGWLERYCCGQEENSK